MFEFVRTHTKLMMFVLVLLIIPSFVFFGVQGYTRFTEGGQATVAKVAGQKITRAEWDAAHARQVELVRQQMPDLDVKLFDAPEARRETLEQMVREQMLFAAAQDLNLAPSDDRLVRELLEMPELSAVKRPDGGLDIEAYNAMLQARGWTAQQFEANLRQNLAIRQVTQGLTDSVVVGDAAAKAALDALLERREVQVQRFEASAYRDKVQPTEADLEAYYKAHEAQFRSPEQAKIEYVVLDLDAIAKGIPVPQEDLRKYYEENAARYTTPQERRASHILIEAPEDAPAAQREQARAKAQALLAEVRKNPESFAAVAKKESQDAGTAGQGGDLGFFGRGAMVKPFEEAAFALKPGEISDVVETDYGYHIIRVTEVRGGQRKAYEEVRAEIENEVRRRLAQQRYAEQAEQFTNTVYEQPDSLQPVIDKLGLTKQVATVQRTPAPGASGPLASPRLLEAVFGEDALRNKRNTEAVETGPNQMASARIVEYMPARTLPLEEVKDRVRERVITQQAAALARKDGEAKVAQLKQGGDATQGDAKAAVSGMPDPVTVARNDPQGLPPRAVDAVLRADPSALPVVLGVDLGEAGYVVARVLKVAPPQAPAEQRKQLEAQVAGAWAQAEREAYLDALRARYKVEVEVPADDGAR